MKKFLLVLTAIMLVFTVVGCNSNGAPTTVVDKSQPTPTPTTPTPSTPGEETPGGTPAPFTVSDFIKGLTGFDSFVKELKVFSDGGPGTFNYGSDTDPNQFAQWTFDFDDIDEADYFVFTTDGSITNEYDGTAIGAKKDGFGGTQVGLQNQGGSYGMSDDKITTKDWTSIDRSDICLFAIKISDLPDPSNDSGGYVGVSSGDKVRIFIGYFNDGNICGLSPDGYAALVKGTLTKPAGAVDVENKSPSKVVGFCAKVVE